MELVGDCLVLRHLPDQGPSNAFWLDSECRNRPDGPVLLQITTYSGNAPGNNQSCDGFILLPTSVPHHNCINTENTEQACFLYQVYEECCGNDKNAIVPIISL